MATNIANPIHIADPAQNLQVGLKSQTTPMDKTAKKINYWAVFGLAFLTIGIITTLIATIAFSQLLFSVTIATSETILGFGSISLALGSIIIYKPLTAKFNAITKKYRVDPRQYSLVGIQNRNLNCWLNSLMQMLLNSPPLKKCLLQNPQFKLFINEYEKALKENEKVDAQPLKILLSTICSSIEKTDSVFHDPQETLLNILDFFRGSNPDLQNFITSTQHFLHPNGSRSINQNRLADNGCISLAPLLKNSPKDSIQRRLDHFFYSEEKTEVDDTKTTQKTIIEPFFFGLRRIKTVVTEETKIGTKTRCLEERKLAFAPKDLFLHISRLENKLNAVEVPSTLTINKKHFENSLDTSYELDSFICHVYGAHYISYIKKDAFWFKCDDESVAQVSLKKVMRAAKQSSLVHYKKLG